MTTPIASGDKKYCYAEIAMVSSILDTLCKEYPNASSTDRVNIACEKLEKIDGLVDRYSDETLGDLLREKICKLDTKSMENISKLAVILTQCPYLANKKGRDNFYKRKIIEQYDFLREAVPEEFTDQILAKFAYNILTQSK